MLVIFSVANMASTCGVVAVAVALFLYPDSVNGQQSRDIELGIQAVHRGLTSGRIRSPGYPNLLTEALEATCIITPELIQLTVTLTEDHIDTFDIDRTCRERIDIISTVKPPKLICENSPEFQDTYLLLPTQSVAISVTKCYSVQGGNFQIEFSASGGGTVKVDCRQKSAPRDLDKCPVTTPSTTSTTTTTTPRPPSTTTTTQKPSESQPPIKTESDQKLVIIIVSVIGGVILLVIIIALIVCLLRARKRKAKPTSSSTSTSTAPVTRNNGMSTLDGRYENVEVSNGVMGSAPPHVNTAVQVTPTDTRAVQTYDDVEMQPTPSTSHGQVYTNVRTKRDRAKQDAAV